ncbi:MAG: dihydroorotase [Clostridiales bacterium]|nr:dihydroorotase [Clostridiales bacterium]
MYGQASNNKTIRYSGGLLLDKEGCRAGVLYTKNGKILYAGPETDLPFDEKVDLAGAYIAPAFVDLHCHLRDPGWPAKETMETGMKAALKGGFATLCAMANTNPVCGTPELVLANHEKAKALDLCRLYQAGAAGENLEDKAATDYEALAAVTPMITNDGKTIFSDDFMRELLKASAKYGFVVSTHCQPERETVARDIRLLEEVGGNLHVGHISRKETLDMIRDARKRGLFLTCEVTPHHLFSWDCDYKVNPPIRTKEDVDALIEGVRDGSIDCLATDHAPHTPEDKAAGMAGISNIEYAAQVFWKVFQENGIPLTRFSEMASFNPAKRIGLDFGLLKEGYDADLVIFKTDVSGTIDPESMISRSHNTPFGGREICGQILQTVVGGEVKYDYR